MFKKSLALASALVLAACTTSIADQKYPNAKFKISDAQVKTYIQKMNNAEQCIHPELKGLSIEQAEERVYSKYNADEKHLWGLEVSREYLVETVGKDNYITIYTDKPSFDYFAEKQKQFNHQNANVDPVECEKFKVKFFDGLEKVKALHEYIRQQRALQANPTQKAVKKPAEK